MSFRTEQLRNNLDDLAKDSPQFELSDMYVPNKEKLETMYVDAEDSIIGREADKEAIVEMLLGDSESSNDIGRNVSFVTIVGIGGIGKSELASLVLNEDDRIDKAFDLRLWVYVSNDFDLEKIFRQMLKRDALEWYDIEHLQRAVRNLIEGKRYLLVLDNTWNESHDEWENLKSILNLGMKGSKVLVTSRSKIIANVVGDDLVYELKGLSEENSWNLFKRLAFEEGKEPMNSNDHLFDIGKEIVRKCDNVPLAIKVVASMLYDQDESKWLSFKNANLIEMRLGMTDVMSILKYSYYHLTPALRSCFSYCALFPKDYFIEKELLIRLWMAHGCLDEPRDRGDKEDVGNEYFSILLHRCFLQDVITDTYGEIKYCMMHDLIHDLAIEVAGKENIMLDISKGRFDHRSCHLSLTPDGCYRLGNPVTPLRDMKTLRTFLTFTRRQTYVDWFKPDVPRICESNAIQICSFNVDAICSHLVRLRVLYLNPLTFYTLPETVNNLSHLRDLDLSGNQKLIALPNSITELYNLQVLNLDGTNIRELPRNTRKLVNLRHLFLRHCKFLTHMPPGLNTLTNLHSLTTFVVGKGTFMQGRLRDLNDLVNLRGELSLIFNQNSSCDLANYRQMEFLRTNHVTELNIQFSDQGAIHETLLDRLQPHIRLKGIQIESYEAFKLPGWAESLSSSLPNLVKIHLVKFDNLEILPSLSELRHLKYLKLKAISNVEFMENDVISPSNEELLFFPSLVALQLSEFPKLKGWWRDDRRKVTGEVGTSSIIVPTFSSLRELILTDCPSLTHLPSCPSLRHLIVLRCHKALTLLENNEAVHEGPTPSSSSGIPLLEMYTLTLDNVGAFHYLCGESHESIWSFRIQGFEGDNLSTLAKKCVRCVSILKELKFLVIWDCPKLKSLSGALKQLTRLQGLTIDKCENLELGNNEEQATMTSWESLHLLSFLRLRDLPKLVYLPQEFQYLTSLRSLSIFNCENLEALPEWISCLTSLHTLKIYKCDKLKSLPEAIAHMPALNTLEIRKCESLERRCREPDGEDWPKVRHLRLDITPVK